MAERAGSPPYMSSLAQAGALSLATSTSALCLSALNTVITNPPPIPELCT